METLTLGKKIYCVSYGEIYERPVGATGAASAWSLFGKLDGRTLEEAVVDILDVQHG